LAKAAFRISGTGFRHTLWRIAVADMPFAAPVTKSREKVNSYGAEPLINLFLIS